MITIYDGATDDFTGMGLGALTPVRCEVQEEAGGRFDLELEQPVVEDGRQELLQIFRVLRVPAPVRPGGDTVVETIAQATETFEIWKVKDNSWLNLRTGPGTGYKRINAYKGGTEVIKEDESGNWMKVTLVNGGAQGWMSKTYLVYSRTETTGGGGSSSIVVPEAAREQLFRIYAVKRDSESRTLTASAQHIFYDLKGVIVASEYAPEGVAASTVCQQLLANADHDAGFQIVCGINDLITGDYTGRNICDCLLNESDGIVKQVGGRIVRDNFTVYILPDTEENPKLWIRRGKNLLSASYTEDAGEVVTRIYPVGKTKKGEPLYLEAPGYVDSPNVSAYPIVYSRMIEYDVTVGSDGIDSESAARAKLTELAQADFSDGGLDLPEATVDADFVRLELLDAYKVMEEAWTTYMYDPVKVTDGEVGISVTMKMTSYKWDALGKRYTETGLGDILAVDSSGMGYEIGGGGGSTRVLTGSIADGAVTLEKIDWESVTPRIQAIIDGTYPEPEEEEDE